MSRANTTHPFAGAGKPSTATYQPVLTRVSRASAANNRLT